LKIIISLVIRFLCGFIIVGLIQHRLHLAKVCFFCAAYWTKFQCIMQHYSVCLLYPSFFLSKIQVMLSC